MSTIKDDNVDTSIGLRLRQARRDRNLNQEKVAQYLEITKNYVSRIEKGERAPSPHLRKAIEHWIKFGDTIASGRGDQNLIGNGSIMAGRDIKGSLNETTLQSGQKAIDLDDDEKELILKLRDVGGKRTLRKFIKELDRIKKILDEEI